MGRSRLLVEDLVLAESTGMVEAEAAGEAGRVDSVVCRGLAEQARQVKDLMAGIL